MEDKTLTQWQKWKKEVFRLMRTEYKHHCGERLQSKDIDWVAWKEDFDEGDNPDDAIREEISYMN